MGGNGSPIKLMKFWEVNAHSCLFDTQPYPLKISCVILKVAHKPLPTPGFFQLKSTADCTPIGRTIRRAAQVSAGQWRDASWSKIRALYRFPEEFWLSNFLELIEQKYFNILYFGFIISLRSTKMYESICLHGSHKIASWATCGPWAAGWKALAYTVTAGCFSPCHNLMHVLTCYESCWPFPLPSLVLFHLNLLWFTSHTC